MPETTSLGDVIRTWLRDDPALAKKVERHRINAHIARQLYDLRKAAGLSQTQLAKMIGTKQSAIARMEDGDYEGHSISQLKKIADAFDCNLTVEFFKKPAFAIDSDVTDVPEAGLQMKVESSELTTDKQYIGYINAINVTLNISSAR